MNRRLALPPSFACRHLSAGATVLLLGLVLPCLHAVTVRADTLWYSGDFDGQSGFINRFTSAASSVPAAKMFENFIVADPLGWNVTDIWSNNFNVPESNEQVDWSIRSNMAPGNAGNILFSGTNSATATPTGRAYQPDPESELLEYSIVVSGIDVFLPPGEYWLNVTPYADRDVLISSSSGQNAVGNPSAIDSNGLWWWSVPGHNYDNTGFGFSMGVGGHLIPQPATGDTNGDGLVDLEDLNNVRNNFGAIGPDDGTLTGDTFPFNGAVDLDDLNNVRNHFGEENMVQSPASVPEPSTLVVAMLSIGVGMVARFRDTSDRTICARTRRKTPARV